MLNRSADRRDQFRVAVAVQIEAVVRVLGTRCFEEVVERARPAELRFGGVGPFQPLCCRTQDRRVVMEDDDVFLLWEADLVEPISLNIELSDYGVSEVG